jgi:hypothetical protein
MSNIIGFLQRAGSNAAMRHASREALLQAMRSEGIVPEYQSAMLQAQGAVLGDLIGVRETMYCSNRAAPAPKKAPAKKTPAVKTPAKQPAKKAPTKRKR